MVAVDVGGGTGFTILGIVKHVDAKNVTILDQSPHQLAKAKQKEPLKKCNQRDEVTRKIMHISKSFILVFSLIHISLESCRIFTKLIIF